MRRPLLAVACVLSAALAFESSAAIASPRIDGSRVTPEVAAGTYVVLLRDQPTALLDLDDAPARARAREELLAGQNEVLASLGDPTTLYRYTAAVDGFAVELTTAQVKQLQADPAVFVVAPSRKATLDAVTPATAAAAASGQPPAVASGAPHGPRQAGAGVVIGVVDSGIWPENPSFAAAPLDVASESKTYPRFSGSCESEGERWSDAACGGKILAAKSYVAGFGADNIASAEYLSPRDASGHGSHVAATAAGNKDVAVTIGKQRFGRISGVAPGAALSIYKACWAAPDPADDGCTSVDTVRAIDQAVADGVDVLNLSLSDADRMTIDPVELALLNASDAGVVVVASAGDGGPARGSVAHPGPWLTTVAATTGESYPGVVTLGDGTELRGSMVSAAAVSKRRIVYAGDVAATGRSARDAAHCVSGSLDASKVDGAIVVCDRGIVPRIAKSETVSRMGAAAMVLANGGPGATETDIHRIPTVHVDAVDRRLILRYLADTERPTASLRAVARRETQPRIAGFSARGPLSDDDSDLIKPDVAATGENVLSAVSPPADLGRLWDLSSGTSMAAARVAGTAAVIRAHHPRWFPAAVKSALMTTARPLPTDSNPLLSGTGVVRTNRAVDPGLVYDADARSWWRYLRGEGLTAADGSPIAQRAEDGSEVNLASVSVGTLVGTQQVTRTVTNVSARTETYVGRVVGLHGVATRLNPSSFRLAPGASQTFTVTFSARRTARYGKVTTGRLTWRGSLGHRVDAAVAVRPDTVRAVGDLTGTGTSGSSLLRADAGVTGTIRTSVVGPVAADPDTVSLTPGGFDPRSPGSSESTAKLFLTVSKAAAAARWEVSGDSDVDLYVYRQAVLVAASTGLTGREQVTLLDPAPGSYVSYVVAPDTGSDGDVAATVTSWAVSDAERSGSLDVSPRRVTVTGTERFDLELSWSRLDRDRRYLSAITYEGSRQVTLVTID